MSGPSIEIVSWGTSTEPWDLGPESTFPNLEHCLSGEPWENRTGDWILYWDPKLGEVDTDLITSLAGQSDDCYHGGLDLGLRGVPADIEFAQPVSVYFVDPDPGISGVSWRLSPRATLIRRSVLEHLNITNRSFETPEAVGLDLGLQLLELGAVSRFVPGMVSQPLRRSHPFSTADTDTLIERHLRSKWIRYAKARSAFRSSEPRRAIKALKAPKAHERGPLVERDRVDIDHLKPKISVVLPTLGRYELLEPILEQIADQSRPPDELVIVDQNYPDKRRPEVYEKYRGNIEVIFQDKRGQWTARNEALRHVTGDYIAFVDDDSEIEPNFIEEHLEGLIRYQADASTGASIAVVGAPPPQKYSFFHVADQFDSGNAMTTREILHRVGAFDLRYDMMRSGDADFGLRVQESGGLVIHNPHAQRIHFKAEAGGLREFGSWDVFRQNGLLTPKPLPSVLYHHNKHFTQKQGREALALGMALAAVPYHRKSQSTSIQIAMGLAREALLSPLTAIRLARAKSRAANLWNQGPATPPFEL